MRRRHVPGPPCLPWPESGPPPGVPLTEVLDTADPWPLLAAAAAALDRLHGFRVAHGGLSDHALHLDGVAVWLAGVPEHAVVDPNGTPRQRDLAYFADLCARRLGQTPAAAPTAGGMLASLAPRPAAPEPAPAPAEERAPAEAETNGPAPAAPPTLPSAPPAWRFVLAAGLLLAAGFGFYAWRRERRVQASEPVEATAPVLSEAASAAIFNLRAALATVEPDAYAKLVQLLAGNDTLFAGQLPRRLAESRIGARARPGVLRMLAESSAGNPDQELLRETAGDCLLLIAQRDDAPALRQLLRETGGSVRRLRFAKTLTSIGAPLDDVELVALAAATIGPEQFDFFRLLRQPLAPATLAAVKERTCRAGGEPLEPWFAFAASLAPAPPGSRDERAALLRKSLRHWLVRPEPAADGWAARTVHLLWLLAPEAPERFWRSLGLDAAAAARLHAALPATLPDNTAPAALGGQNPRDDWHAAVVGWAGAGTSSPLLRMMAVLPPQMPVALETQGRVLAWAAADPAMRPRVLEELAAASAGRFSSMAATLGVQATLAALAKPEAPLELPAAHQLAAWEGLMLGAALNPAANRAVLAAGRQHPLPTVWRRAADGLALLEGRRAGLRDAGPAPALAPALAAVRAEFDQCRSPAEAAAALARCPDLSVGRFALALSAAEGAHRHLERLARDGSDPANRLLLANSPHRLGPHWLGDFGRRRNFDQTDQFMILHLALQGDGASLSGLENLAYDNGDGATVPPAAHQALAFHALGWLYLRGKVGVGAERLLAAIDREPHLVVRHAAAVALARCATPGDAPAIARFLAERPDLPAALHLPLKLAQQP